MYIIEIPKIHIQIFLSKVLGAGQTKLDFPAGYDEMMIIISLHYSQTEYTLIVEASVTLYIQ